MHLFTPKVLEEAGVLLEMVVDNYMVMVLPKVIPTLEAKSTKNWTWPDNIFCSANMANLVVSCNTDPRLRGPGVDHVPILRLLELQVQKVEAASFTISQQLTGACSELSWRRGWGTYWPHIC